MATHKSLALCILLGLAVAALAHVQASLASEVNPAAFLEKSRTEHKLRQGSRRAAHVARHHVSALFRRLDDDHDKLLSKEDMQASAHKVAHSGVTAEHLTNLVDAADRNGDGKLNLDEMFAAFEDQLAPELLEVVAKAVQAPKPEAKADAKIPAGLAGIDTSNDGCVICQFIVERIETAVRAAGVVPTHTPFGYQNADGVYLEADAKMMGQAKTSDPFDLTGEKKMGPHRLATRFARVAEKQQYNEIYRIADIALDDVCESSMPNVFYGYCKNIYETQQDIADGLRYQYKPVDICYRIGMCKPTSYIAQGIHSRFKNMTPKDGKDGAKDGAKPKGK